MANQFKRLIPMFDRVLVQKSEQIAITEGGIVLPEKAREDVLKGTVIAVGPGARSSSGNIIPMTIKIGDNVLLPQFGSNSKVSLGDEKEYHLFRESDILAKVE